MDRQRSTRRRDAQRAPKLALPAACLLLGGAAIALVALASREPGSADISGRGPTRVAVPATRPAVPAHARDLPSPSDGREGRVAVAPEPVAAARSADDRPHPGTERAFYEQDLQLATRHGALADRARQLFLDGEGSDPERVAALRALWDSATPGAADWFAVALRPPPDAPAPQGALSVGEFALGFLGARAAREPAALELLAQLPADAAAPRALRRGAALSVVATADAPGLRRLATDVAADDDPDFRAQLARASARNDAPEAVALFTSGGP